MRNNPRKSASRERLSLEELDDVLRAQLEEGRHEERQALITRSEAVAVQVLLEELHSLYPHERLGATADALAARLVDRLGDGADLVLKASSGSGKSAALRAAALAAVSQGSNVRAIGQKGSPPEKMRVVEAHADPTPDLGL